MSNEALKLLKQHIKGRMEKGEEFTLEPALVSPSPRATVQTKPTSQSTASPATPVHSTGPNVAGAASLKDLRVAAPIASIKGSAVPAAPAVVTGELDTFRQAICECQKCPLGKTRTNFVFGEGSPTARLVFVGEAPGADEDAQGRPFVGAAGKLLTKIIEAMGMKREDVFICNVLKCRPPENREPQPSEVEQCEPYLIRQIELIKPRVICALGKYAAQTLLKSVKPIGQLRGAVHEYQGIPLIATFHPAACLYNPEYKKDVWQDMKKIMSLLAEAKS